MYHIAHLLARRNLTVLMVDCDSQGNITSYSLNYSEVTKAWRDDGNSIFQVIDPVYRTTGDIRNRSPSPVTNARGSLYIVPGDLRLSNFEDLLGDTWSSARGGAARPARSVSYSPISKLGARQIKANLVLIDLGPNLGALNRAVLASNDYFITPVAPDLFSIQGTENLSNKLVAWRREWDQCNTAWAGGSISIPKGRLTYLGYVIQMHNIRSNSDGMTAGWQIYGDQPESAIAENIVKKLTPIGQVINWQGRRL